MYQRSLDHQRIVLLNSSARGYCPQPGNGVVRRRIYIIERKMDMVFNSR